jgi:hypothetical protein
VVRRRRGALLIVSAPVLFILSGLFLANTVVNPVESLVYKLGEALCFIAAPVLLISGIVVYITAPHERKKKRATFRVAGPPSREEPATVAYSATRLLVRRIIGVAFILVLLAAPFIAEGTKGVNFFLAMFVLFPAPAITLPYLAVAVYLASGKRPRRIDALAIAACVVLLLLLLVPGMSVLMVFFLPFILFSTPFGLIGLLLLIAIAILVAAVRRKRKR